MTFKFVITFDHDTFKNSADVKALRKQFRDAWNIAAPSLQIIPGLTITHVGRFGCHAEGKDGAVRLAVDSLLQPPLVTQDPTPAPTAL